MTTLHENSLLQGGRYSIVKVLGQGGFGVTYLGIQCGLERKVAIKEFFMKEFCERDETTSHVTLGTEGSRATVERFREKFLKEARNLAKLNHPNIVRVIDVFEENGTAYYVMDYAEGGSLASKLNAEGYLSEPVATRYIKQVAEALAYIHNQRMNHLDVKPANVMLNDKDDCVLIDFGLSKQYDITGSQTSTTPVGISEGYAPMEQYKQGGVGEFSPETDVYSLGATFFKLLTGKTPPSALDVNEDGVPVNELEAKGVSKPCIDLICKAMESRKKDRMASALDFINALGDAQCAEPKKEKPQPAESEETKVIPNEKEVKAEPKTKPTPKPALPKEEVRPYIAPKEPAKAPYAMPPKPESSNQKFIVMGVVGAVLLVALVVIGVGIKACGGSNEDEAAMDSAWMLDSIQAVTGATTIAPADTAPGPVYAEEVIAESKPAKEKAEKAETKVQETEVKTTVATTSAPEKSAAQEKESVVQASTVEQEPEDNLIYDVPEVMASFSGGEAALSTWLGNHLQYPEIAQEQGVQGRVLVNFVVEKDGSISNIEIRRSPSDDLSKEAIRVVRSMPKWKPARQGGRIVRSKYLLPVMFRLQ